MNKNTDFPQYRRLKGWDVYFKIQSLNRFVEVKKMGSKWLLVTIDAIQYPEKMRIVDMIDLIEGYELLTEEEWNEKVNMDC